MTIMQVVKEENLKYPPTNKMRGTTFVKTKNTIYIVINARQINNRCAYKLIPITGDKSIFECTLKTYSKNELLQVGETFTSTDEKDTKKLIKELLEV